MTPGHPINCTALTGVTVQTLCSLLDQERPGESGPYAVQITCVTDRPGQDARDAMAPGHIREKLGRPPSVTVEAGLARPLQAREGVKAR